MGAIGENPIAAELLPIQLTASSVPLAAASGFADQRGGGIFVDAEGKPVRLRIDGSVAALESHPANGEAPGRVQRVLPIGADSAWVVADNGVYTARAGFLYELRLGRTIDAQALVAAAAGGEERAFVALTTGLFRLDDGTLSELRVDGQPISGVTALAVAPAPDGSAAVWFTQGKRLRFAKQLPQARYEIGDSGLGEEVLGDGVIALAGVTAAPGTFGELWVLTPNTLLHHTPERGFQTLEVGSQGHAMLGAGRYVWLQTQDKLFRYAADTGRWSRVQSSDRGGNLLAVDASGSAWLQNNGDAAAVSETAMPRVLGLFEAGSVYLPDVQVSARLLANAEPQSVTFTLDDGERIERKLEQAYAPEADSGSLDFSLGGFDASGSQQTYSFAGLAPGLHTLTVQARHAGGATERRLHFDLRSSTAEALSYARDIAPIFSARCAKCHLSGPGHMLASYEQWRDERQKIVRAIVELRMPADGPLDPAQIRTIQRWAAAGGAP